jgi:hypothetical protein
MYYNTYKHILARYVVLRGTCEATRHLGGDSVAMIIPYNTLHLAEYHQRCILCYYLLYTHHSFQQIQKMMIVGSRNGVEPPFSRPSPLPYHFTTESKFAKARKNLYLNISLHPELTQHQSGTHSINVGHHPIDVIVTKGRHKVYPLDRGGLCAPISKKGKSEGPPSVFVTLSCSSSRWYMIITCMFYVVNNHQWSKLVQMKFRGVFRGCVFRYSA